jgi:dethiobiotin synthetase
VKDIYTKDFILEYSGLESLGHIPQYNVIDKSIVIEAGNYVSL